VASELYKAFVSVEELGTLPSVHYSGDTQELDLGLTPDHICILSCSPTQRGFHGGED